MKTEKRKALSSIKDLKNALDAIEKELEKSFVSKIYIFDKAYIIERRTEYLKTLF